MSTEQQEPPTWARELAAQAWCRPQTSHKTMDVELGDAFAAILANETAALAQENQRLREAAQKAYMLSAMRSEPYIPPYIRQEIESTLQSALEGKEGKP